MVYCTLISAFFFGLNIKCNKMRGVNNMKFKMKMIGLGDVFGTLR